MTRFVFRAQAALDLRRKQDDEARRQLAAAHMAARVAEQALEAARGALDAAMGRCRDREAQGGTLDDVLWYRNWIVVHRQAVERCRADLSAREAEVDRARQRALVAHRKLRAIERFRERAWREYLRGEQRREQKTIDELGTQRFVLGRATTGGEM